MRDHQPASVPGESVFALSAETMLRVKMQPECSGDPCHGIVEVVPRSFRATRRTIPELLVRTAFAAVFLAIAPQLATADSRKADRPNVLLITADDLGLQLGVYGDRIVSTPHLDRLSEGGMRFENAYVTSASCSSSRASLLTGLYPHQNGQTGLAHLGNTMRPGLPNLVSLLRAQGYRTGIIGKLHVEPEAEFPFDFDRKEIPATREKSAVRSMCEEFWGEAKGGPFFLYINLFDPHDPFVVDINGSPEAKVSPSEAATLPFLDKDTPQLRAQVADYLTCVNRLDEIVGEILASLAAQGLDANTIVVFVSDNGPPFARAKVTCYEAGVRIPLIINWPEHFKTGVADELVSSIDLMPTVLELAGAPAMPGLPGLSLLPLLKGKPMEWRRQIFTEYNSHEPRMVNPRRAVREGRHKLIMTLLADPDLQWPDSLSLEKVRTVQKDAGQGEFLGVYDLEKDPHEFNNLAGRPEMKEVQDRLVQALQQWRLQTKDPLLEPSNMDRLLQEAMLAMDTNTIFGELRRKQEAAKRAGRRIPNTVTPEEIEKLRASQSLTGHEFAR